MQCKGKTKTGEPCKNQYGLVNGYCRFHQDQNNQEQNPSSIPSMNNLEDDNVNDSYPETENNYNAEENNSSISSTENYSSNNNTQLYWFMVALISILFLFFYVSSRKTNNC